MRDKHGHARHDENGRQSRAYRIWRAMKTRCLNKKNKAYPDYGGRGITICDRWMRFPYFLSDMGHPPRGMSLDRINNMGPYSPENCRWTTATEQARNRRSNHMLTALGETKSMIEWADQTGIPIATIWARVSKYGWSDEKAVTAPVRRNIRWHGTDHNVRWSEKSGVREREGVTA